MVSAFDRIARKVRHGALFCARLHDARAIEEAPSELARIGLELDANDPQCHPHLETSLTKHFISSRIHSHNASALRNDRVF